LLNLGDSPRTSQNKNSKIPPKNSFLCTFALSFLEKDFHAIKQYV